MADWRRCSSCKPVDGAGIFVQRESQLGYAKLNYLAPEKLGADLAQLAGAPVPTVEIDLVEGHGPFAISHVHSKLSRPLAAKGQFSQNYSSSEKAALRSASGLLPFFAWIAAEDHYDDTNLVVDELGDGQCRVVAVDFEHAFRWTPGEDKVILQAPPGLIANIDPLIVRDNLAMIEGITAEQIGEACKDSGYPPELQTQIARILQHRQRRGNSRRSTKDRNAEKSRGTYQAEGLEKALVTHADRLERVAKVRNATCHTPLTLTKKAVALSMHLLQPARF